jgi:hypothetical protein
MMSGPYFVFWIGIALIAGFVYLIRKIVWERYAYTAGAILLVAFLCWLRAAY